MEAIRGTGAGVQLICEHIKLSLQPDNPSKAECGILDKCSVYAPGVCNPHACAGLLGAVFKANRRAFAHSRLLRHVCVCTL